MIYSLFLNFCSFLIKLFLAPKIVIVPFPVIFLNSKKKKSRLRRKICAPHGQHIPVSRGFSEEYEEMGGVLPRFFLSNVRIIPDSGAKTVLRQAERFVYLQLNKKKAKAEGKKCHAKTMWSQ